MISCCGGRVSGEENYRRFEGLVVVAQPLDFRLQLVDFGLLSSGCSGSGSGVDLGLHQPLARHFAGYLLAGTGFGVAAARGWRGEHPLISFGDRIRSAGRCGGRSSRGFARFNIAVCAHDVLHVVDPDRSADMATSSWRFVFHPFARL